MTRMTSMQNTSFFHIRQGCSSELTSFYEHSKKLEKKQKIKANENLEIFQRGVEIGSSFDTML